LFVVILNKMPFIFGAAREISAIICATGFTG